MRVVDLDGRTFEEHRAAILSVEAEVCRATGPAYAAEPWTAENFIRPMPGKERLSVLALDEGSSAITGFLVAHVRHGPAHVSRLAVAPAWQRRGVARALFDGLWRRARASGIPRMTIQVAADNRGAVTTYHAVGLRRLVGDALAGYIASHGLAAAAPAVSGDVFVDADGRAYAAFEAPVPP